MTQKVMYTQEQLDIALLKNNQVGVLREMTHIRDDFHAIRAEIKSNFHWTLGLMITIGAGGIVSILAKSYGWF